MALKITFQTGEAVEWSEGQPNPVPLERAHTVREVTFDGIEKNHVMKMFPYNTNIPKRRGAVTLHGSIARTLVANLVE